MDSRTEFVLIGILSIIIIAMWTHNDDYDLKFSQANSKYDSKAQLDRAVIKYAKREGLALN